MSREYEDYRVNLERIIARFGDVATINIGEAAEFLGISEATVRKDAYIPRVRIGRRLVVPTTGLARCLSKYEGA